MALNEASYSQPAAFKELPQGPEHRHPRPRPFAQVRNLQDKQFGNIQIATPERRFTPPAEQFSAWGAA